VFDPGFAERSGRVMAGNWGLFMARQVIREHGGDMRVERNPGGAALVVSLPARLQAQERSAV
jgi:signal transduction histidine kinase